jgi:hypothetical protein
MRQSLLGVLTRGPAAVTSPASRTAVTILVLIGAVLTAGSGVLHLYLWGETNGYRQIPTIGPLFLAQGISAIVIGLLTAVTRRVFAVLAAAGLLVSTVGGLILTIELSKGLFGFKESWSAPYVSTSLYVEIAGAVLLLAAVWPLVRPRSGQTAER